MVLTYHHEWFYILALELLRKKIEMATERIRAAKLKEEQAKQVFPF